VSWRSSARRRPAASASDIDLLVTFEPEARVGFLALARMQRELEELLGRKVDLVPKGGLKPAIRDAVLATARVLYAACTAHPHSYHPQMSPQALGGNGWKSRRKPRRLSAGGGTSPNSKSSVRFSVKTSARTATSTSS
jgi:predicted nucleotidyltransferase